MGSQDHQPNGKASGAAQNIREENVQSAAILPSPLDLFSLKFALTEREKEIFEMMLNGMSNQEISEKLVISLGTAKTHSHHIFSKINVSNRREALRTYQEFCRNLPSGQSR
ncbi:MAG: helix-turn-helix transcriptional regulator [Eubacterium sp.]|nr:helix-turn-helix transcriptional regulator [Eubacterium sp.]